MTKWSPADVVSLQRCVLEWMILLQTEIGAEKTGPGCDHRVQGTTTSDKDSEIVHAEDARI